MPTPPTGEQLSHALFHTPIVPYIRHADFAVRKPWRVRERRLLDYLLIYIQEGHCAIQVEDKVYSFREGEFCLIQPNELLVLEGITDTITPFAHMDIFYHPEREKSFPALEGQIDISAFSHLLQPRLNDCSGIHIPVKFTPTQPEVFRETLLKMIGVWQQRDVISQLEAQQAATELVLALLRDQQLRSGEVFQEPQTLNWVTSYLSFHLDEPISIADMAQRAHLSPSRFSALFRQRFGMSPHQYLLHLRVQHAQSLLRQSNLSLQHIAYSCGFADIHHFSRVFKHLVGSPPGHWRSDWEESQPDV